jgi:hypothetical protein
MANFDGQTTKGDFVAMFGGGGGGPKTEKGLGIVWGLRSPVDLDHVPIVLWEPIRGFHDLLRSILIPQRLDQPRGSTKSRVEDTNSGAIPPLLLACQLIIQAQGKSLSRPLNWMWQ